MKEEGTRDYMRDFGIITEKGILYLDSLENIVGVYKYIYDNIS